MLRVVPFRLFLSSVFNSHFPKPLFPSHLSLPALCKIMVIKYLMIICLVFGGISPLNLYAGEKTNLSNSFIGAWDSRIDFDNGLSVYMSILYKDNGTCKTYVEYTLKESSTIYAKADVEEIWEIKGDEIHYKVVSSTNERIFQVGYESKAKIISIAEKVITLIGFHRDDTLKDKEYKIIRK